MGNLKGAWSFLEHYSFVGKRNVQAYVIAFGAFAIVFGCSASGVQASEMTVDEQTVHLAPYFEAVVEAIYLAEGGTMAVKPYGILSVPCSDKADCRKVCYNTVRNNYWRWVKAGRRGEYLAFLARRYCPVGASNDPHGLNRNWLNNVRGLM